MVITLRIYNHVTYIIGKIPSEIYKILKKQLGYLPENAMFMVEEAAKKNANRNWGSDWDGYVSTICWSSKFCKCSNKKEGTHFPTGLVSRAIQVLRSYGIEVKIEDCRQQVYSDLNLSMTENFEFRDYQKQVVDSACNVDRGIIKMCTGAGKTAIASAIIARRGVTPTIFYVTSIDLLTQAKKELEKFIKQENLNITVGELSGGKKDIQDITVMTVQTAVQALGGVWKKFDEEDSSKEKVDISNIKTEVKDLIQSAKLIICDEVQHWASETCQIISDNSVSARYRYGMSIFPESVIELRGGIFGQGMACTIEESWQLLLNQNYGKYYEDNGYEIIQTEGIESRGWDGNNFTWKAIKRFIRHNNDKNCYSVKFANLAEIKMTEDHSIFKIKNNEILECSPTQLKQGDSLLIDNGNNFERNLKNLTALDILSLNPQKMRVALDLSVVSPEQIELSEDKYRKLAHEGKIALQFGGSLSLKEYLKFKDLLPYPDWIYLEEESNTGISPNLTISDISYIVGYYIGNGQLYNNNISFVINKAFESDFMQKILNIEMIKTDIKVKCMQIENLEIECFCPPLYSFLDYYFSKEKHFERAIPNDLLFDKKEVKEQLIKGLIDSNGNNEDFEFYSYITDSKSLKNNLCLILRSLSISYYVCKSLSINNEETYQIVWSHFFSQKRSDTTINCIEKKVTNIEQIQYNGYVYDLEMEGHPSFVAEGVLVHNSATPYRDKGDDILIDACFGKVIADINASKLIRMGFLVKPYITFIPIDNMKDIKKKDYSNIYKEGIINNQYRNNLIAALAQNMASEGKTVLILCKQIAHGKLLENMIEGSKFIYGDHSAKKRQKHISAMRTGQEAITIASTIFDEGVDCKTLDGLILAGSGKSETRALQRIGRVLRPYTFPDGRKKEQAMIVDFMDNAKYLKEHSKKRLKIYQSESEFDIKVL